MLRSVAGIIPIVVCVWSSACGSSSPSAPSEPPQTPNGTGLRFSWVSVSASLERWAGAPWDIGYSYCYNLSPMTPDVASMTFRRVDYTTVGPQGQIYNTSSDSSLVGQPVGFGRAGCFYTYPDQDIARPVATTYRITFQYAAAGAGQPTTQTVTGNIASEVPPQPFITNVTLTHDIKDPQRILRQPTPVTFTVANVEGGTPPLLYKWALNGFMLRDWDPNPVLVWDGTTLGDRPIVHGTYTLVVSVRRSTWHDLESGASVSFSLLF